MNVSALPNADRPHRALDRAFTPSVRNWLATPTGAVVLLISFTMILRLAFASALGLGIDESYMVATARVPQLSYFDHPPLSWWLTFAGTRLFGSDAPLAVRFPFVATFALTTWLIYRLGATLFDPRTGLWTAVLLNLTSMFGVAFGSWVLPDGPLNCALLGAALCLVHAVDPEN